MCTQLYRHHPHVHTADGTLTVTAHSSTVTAAICRSREQLYERREPCTDGSRVPAVPCIQEQSMPWLHHTILSRSIRWLKNPSPIEVERLLHQQPKVPREPHAVPLPHLPRTRSVTPHRRVTCYPRYGHVRLTPHRHPL